MSCQKLVGKYAKTSYLKSDTKNQMTCQSGNITSKNKPSLHLDVRRPLFLGATPCDDLLSCMSLLDSLCPSLLR